MECRQGQGAVQLFQGTLHTCITTCEEADCLALSTGASACYGVQCDAAMLSMVCMLAGRLADLQHVDFGPPLHSLVVPGHLHEMEQSMLAALTTQTTTGSA